MAEGKVGGILLATQDITPQIESREKLRENQERLSLLIDAGELGTWDWDMQKDTVVWSDRRLALFGLPPGTPMTYERFLQAIHPDDRDRVDNAIQAALKSSSDYKIDMRTVWPDGSIHWIASRGRIYGDSQGQPVRMTGVAIDITHTKEVEEALREQAELLDLSNEGIFTWQLRGAIEYWNQGATRLYGYRREEAIGKVSHDLLATVHPEGKERFLDRLEQEGFQQAELIHRTKDGRKIVVESVHQLITLGGRKLVLETNRDLTERKRSEQSIRQLNLSLERKVEERTQQLQTFVYSMSHDLRAPLRGMQYFSNALAEDHQASLNEEGRDFLRRIIASGSRMENLIEDLLVYSRLDSSEISLGPVSLDIAVKDACQDLATDIDGKHASISIAPPLGSVLGNRPTLELIISNLLSNALKFVPANTKPMVSVWSERSEGRIKLYVKDNGIGVPPEHAERIFKVFERLHGLDSYPGTGMGLAIVQKAVQRLGGSVGLVASNQSEGSIFWMELPAAEAK
jgi:PAS domain S-box-containing protein